jgi:simple sugar transport system ATP-binding protein
MIDVVLRGIVKRFPGVVANDGADLAVRSGGVHAVVGQNGSGKTTLMSILAGILRPDAGTIRLDGRPVRFSSPRDAIAAGIAMVHQHFMLADNLTVLENVVLGAEPRRGWRIDTAAARRRIRGLSAEYGLAVDPDQTVDGLGVGERQRVEIIKVLYRRVRLLILDEPTAVLSPTEAMDLLANLSRLAARGMAVVLVSHRFDEILSVAQTVTVMRKGRTVAVVSPQETTPDHLAELVIGGEPPEPGDEPGPASAPGAVELTVAGLGVADGEGRLRVENVSFDVRGGEVVGIAGLEGDGQREVIEALVGVRLPVRGTIRLGGRDITHASPRLRRRLGLGYVPEDRQRSGLLLPSPVWENAALGRQASPPLARGPWIDPGRARRRATAICQEAGVVVPTVDISARALSGGNQQRLVVTRELAATPRLLVAAQPTRGVDVAARTAVHGALLRARARGSAVVLVSADLDELVALSDRVLVMRRGKLAGPLPAGPVTAAAVGRLMADGRRT